MIQAESHDIAQYLKAPEMFMELGRKLKGFEIVASPGMGKTMLAKAIASEARFRFRLEK